MRTNTGDIGILLCENNSVSEVRTALASWEFCEMKVTLSPLYVRTTLVPLEFYDVRTRLESLKFSDFSTTLPPLDFCIVITFCHDIPFRKMGDDMMGIGTIFVLV